MIFLYGILNLYLRRIYAHCLCVIGNFIAAIKNDENQAAQFADFSRVYQALGDV